MLLEPRRGEYTICTAIAPEAIFTVRTYATRRGYEPRLVRKFTGLRPQTCTSHLYTRANHDPMIKVRFQLGLYSACGVARFQASSNAATISRMVRGSELKV